MSSSPVKSNSVERKDAELGPDVMDPEPVDLIDDESEVDAKPKGTTTDVPAISAEYAEAIRLVADKYRDSIPTDSSYGESECRGIPCGASVRALMANLTSVDKDGCGTSWLCFGSHVLNPSIYSIGSNVSGVLYVVANVRINLAKRTITFDEMYKQHGAFVVETYSPEPLSY